MKQIWEGGHKNIIETLKEQAINKDFWKVVFERNCAIVSHKKGLGSETPVGIIWLEADVEETCLT